MLTRENLTRENRVRRRDHPFGLRRLRTFPQKELYYGVIAIDLVLRFTWLSRLSSNLDRVNNAESGIFLLMFLEIARRWMWVFFRIETEWGECPFLCLFLFLFFYFFKKVANLGCF